MKVWGGVLLFWLLFVPLENRGIGGESPLPLDHPYSRFLEVVQSRDESPTRLDDLLPRLSAELRSGFTFIFSSRSPHGARGEVDPLHPRVLLFTPDGRLLLAFTSNKNGSGYGVVESIHFNDADRAFYTSKFVLREATRKDPRLKSELLHNGELNQRECIRCHGTDPRPIFDSYPLWPGFYGSLEDGFLRGSPEATLYERFLKTKKDQSPFRYLKFGSESKMTPYEDGTAKAPEMDPLRFRPNERLGIALTDLNWRRIARQLERSPSYGKYARPLAGGLADCWSIPIEGYADPIQNLLAVEDKYRLSRMEPFVGKITDQKFRMQELNENLPENLAKVVYASRLFGVSREEWSMSLEKRSLGFFDGLLTGRVRDSLPYIAQDFLSGMLEALSIGDPGLRAVAPVEPQSIYPFFVRVNFEKAAGNSELCGRLRGGPLPELEYSQTGPPPSQPHPVPGTATCVECHEPSHRSFVGIEIPFSDSPKLRRLVEQTGLAEKIRERVESTQSDRMPPSGPHLSRKEKKQLFDFLQLPESRE